ncbi:MAG: hypothetical protein ABIS03_14840 [Gemmatimonadaceae bacterium]
MPDATEDLKAMPRFSRGGLALAVVCYAILVTLLAFQHEMWRDEVRAFSVATRPDTWGAMFRELHYEGHPALWYIILRAGFALFHSPVVLPGATIIGGIVSAWFILRYSPFPLWLRLLTVFGVFLSHELAVNSRNYGIGVTLMLLACVLYQSDSERPLLLAIVLGLLANTSIHGAIASLVILFLWLASRWKRSTEAGDRIRLGGPAAIVIAGVFLALVMARPSPDMAWAFSLRSVEITDLGRTLLSDPGWSLRGHLGANIAATGELPWRFMGIGAEIAGRVVVNLALLALALVLFRRPASLIAALGSILMFEFLFREVYSGSLRHHAFLFFLLFSIGWMTVARQKAPQRAAEGRRVAWGLLPLVAFQAVALPITAVRTIRTSESASKDFSRLIHANPRYRDAILMSDPDYMIESMPYYVNNPVYMPRQREFHYRVLFDNGKRRHLNLSLGELLDIAEGLSCSRDRPVLLALGHIALRDHNEGHARAGYKGSLFTWEPEEAARLRRESRRAAAFRETTTDEAYDVFEISDSTFDCSQAMRE